MYMKPILDVSEVESLTKQVKGLNKNLSWNKSFIRGIASGLGTAIGAGLVVTLIVVILKQLTNLPVLGQLFTFLVGNLQHLQ
jgi:hypothetical protein